jgi:hypothetical protein
LDTLSAAFSLLFSSFSPAQRRSVPPVFCFIAFLPPFLAPRFARSSSLSLNAFDSSQSHDDRLIPSISAFLGRRSAKVEIVFSNRCPISRIAITRIPGSAHGGQPCLALEVARLVLSSRN